MVVWGGVNEDPGQSLTELRDGGVYNPATNSWSATTLTNAPIAREGAVAAWTGSRMLIWGGFTVAEWNPVSNPPDVGAAYDPAGNAWSAISTVNAPMPRSMHTAVWTGSQFVVWGGESSSAASPEGNANGLDTGGRYNPTSDTWTATADDAPSPHAADATVWTGTEMLVWGDQQLARDDRNRRARAASCTRRLDRNRDDLYRRRQPLRRRALQPDYGCLGDHPRDRWAGATQ